MRILAISHAAILDVNRELFYELTRRDHEVMLVVPSRWRNDYGTRHLEPEPLSEGPNQRVTLGAYPVLSYRKTAIHLYVTAAWITMLCWRPDVVFIDEEPWSPATLEWLGFAKLARAPSVVVSNENRRRTYPPPLSWIRKAVLASADHVLTISEDGLRVLERDGCAAKASIFPHAIDTALFYPNPRHRHSDRTLHLGFVGRVAPQKGVDTLLRAIALVTPSAARYGCLAAHIFGAGDDAYATQLHQLRQALALPEDVVRWHGPVAHRDVPDVMRSLDVLVIPTQAHQGYKEQFGRVVIEALGCRVPVITSDNGELPHLVRKTGGGFVFGEGDAQALADCIAAAMASPEKLAEMASRGYDYVRTHYTYEVLADDLERILGCLVHQRFVLRRTR